MLPGQSTIIEQGCLTANAMLQGDAVAHGTIASDMAPAVDEFSIGNGELDLDCPTEGFSPISEAIEDIRQGKVCLYDHIVDQIYCFLSIWLQLFVLLMIYGLCLFLFAVCDCCR